MAWEDGYIDASFRGVPFYVRRAGKEGGRRVAEHEFPRSDVTEFEDLGGVSSKFTLDAFLLGPLYFDDRNAFEAALEEGTVGILVHPYRGTCNARVVGRYQATETSEEGGMVRYSIPFAKIEELTATRAAPNTKWVCRSVKEETYSSVLENFARVFAIKQSVSAAAETFQYGASQVAALPAATMRDARNAFDLGLGVIDTAKVLVGSAADFKREVENTKGRIDALALNLEYITESVKDLVDWGTESGTSPRDQLRELRRIAEFAETIVGETTDSESFDSPPRQVQELFEQLAIVAQVGVFADAEFTTVEDAEEIKNQIFTDIDRLCESPNLSGDLFALLRDCKTAVYNDFLTRSLYWPRLQTIQLPATTNTLAFLYSRYGHIDGEQEFIDRNEIIHPGFIPGGVDIKVTTS